MNADQLLRQLAIEQSPELRKYIRRCCIQKRTWAFGGHVIHVNRWNAWAIDGCEVIDLRDAIDEILNEMKS